jgi:hypothetical protein
MQQNATPYSSTLKLSSADSTYSFSTSQQQQQLNGDENNPRELKVIINVYVTKGKKKERVIFVFFFVKEKTC